MSYWTVAYTSPGAERKARDGIQALDRGTFVPTFAKVWYREGRKNSFERPLLSRYVLFALNHADDPIWGEINHVDGVQRVLAHNGVPANASEIEIGRLMLGHATGAYNQIQYRDAGGRFRKQKRRRPRPRPGKRVRGRMAMERVTG
jgi:transcription antitermination factor NusG